MHTTKGGAMNQRLISIYILMIYVFGLGFTPHAHATPLSPYIPESQTATSAPSTECAAALLSDEQILAQVQEELQTAKLYTPRTMHRLLLRVFAKRITKEVLRICADIGGCTAADITELTENEIITRLKTASKTEHSIRVWAGYTIIVGAMISSAAAGGILKDSLSESYKWVADYLVTPAVWLGILKLGEPLWRNLNGRFATVGYKLTTGDTELTHLHTAATRHFDAIYDNMRNDFTEEQNRAALLLHTALSRVEAAASDVYEYAVTQNNYVQAGARLVFTLTVLRTIFPFVPLDEPLLVEAIHVRLSRRILDRISREQIYAATMAAMPDSLEHKELTQLKQVLKTWLMLGADQP